MGNIFGCNPYAGAGQENITEGIFLSALVADGKQGVVFPFLQIVQSHME